MEHAHLFNSPKCSLGRVNKHGFAYVSQSLILSSLDVSEYKQAGHMAPHSTGDTELLCVTGSQELAWIQEEAASPEVVL